MASLNRVMLIGNVGKKSALRHLPSGDAVINIRLATTDRYKSKEDGGWKELTEWHSVSFFSRLAEIVDEHVSVGGELYIEGKNRTRKWSDKGVDRYSTEVVADRMQMLGGKRAGDNSASLPDLPGDDDMDLDAPPF